MGREVRAALALTVAAALGSVADAATLDKGPYPQNVSQRAVTLVWEVRPSMACQAELLGADGQLQRTVLSDASSLHEVRLDQLEVGRRYRYAVSCGELRSEGEFATAPESTAPFTFVVFGDSRSNAGRHRAVVERIRREVPDFLLGTGDLVNEGDSLADWQQFFEIERELLRDNVMFPSVGNHDRQGRGRTADNFRRYFSVPENSPDPERYYAFTYGNSRFLVLDSNAYSFALSDQTDWIEAQLQAARMDRGIRHIFVTMHHPPFSTALHGGQRELRNAWTPLFEKYRVDAVFSGHDHCYARADHNGVVYIVSGGGGAPLYPRSKSPSEHDIAASRYFERVNHYVRAHVVGEYVELAAYRADGSLIETISWGDRPRRPEAVRALAVGQAPGAEAAEAPESGANPADSSIRPGKPAAGRFGTAGLLGAALVLLGAAAMFVISRRF